jgi:hypothetical protein
VEIEAAVELSVAGVTTTVTELGVTEGKDFDVAGKDVCLAMQVPGRVCEMKVVALDGPALFFEKSTLTAAVAKAAALIAINSVKSISHAADESYIMLAS